jgi:hypothetical protein
MPWLFSAMTWRIAANAASQAFCEAKPWRKGEFTSPEH